MRVDVDKILLVGSIHEQEVFFQHVQRSGGLLEFLGQPVHVGADLSNWIDQSQAALKILHHQPERPQERLPPHKVPEEIVQEIISLENERLSLEERQRMLSVEFARVEPFGRFNTQDVRWLESITQRRMRYFFCPAMTKHAERPSIEGLIYIGSAYDLEYFAGLLHEEVVPTPYVEMESLRPIQEVQDELKDVRDRLRKVQRQLEHMASWTEELAEQSFRLIDRRSLRQSLASVRPLMEGHLFAAFAWMPRTQKAKVHQLCRRYHILMRTVEPDLEDRVPTELENHGVNRIGQDLVQFYDTPSQSDRDPSGWVLWAFAVFFAMIVNDAGYGLLFVLGALLVGWKQGKLRGAAKRTQKLVLLLGVFSVVWGLGVHSFFGINLAPTSGLVSASPLEWMVEKKAEYHMEHKDQTYQGIVKQFPAAAEAKTGQEFLQKAVDTRGSTPKYRVLESFNGSVLMELALFVGVLHLTLGMCRHLDRSPSGLGWILFMWGGFLYAPSLLKGTSFFQYALHISATGAERYGFQVMVAGVGLACVLALIQKRWWGLDEIMKGVSIFSDILSYLRLYALGLAGAIIASTVNDLGAAVGLFGGTLIILVGHGVNITMTIMSGIIHGLRLNFLEWYHTCFEGGGRPFCPLRLCSKSSD